MRAVVAVTLVLALCMPRPGVAFRDFLYQCLCTNPINQRVDELCCCDVPFVERLNKERVAATVDALVQTTYFSFYRADLYRDCPFWQGA